LAVSVAGANTGSGGPFIRELVSGARACADSAAGAIVPRNSGAVLGVPILLKSESQVARKGQFRGRCSGALREEVNTRRSCK
jgi:hypothetical protein